MNQATINKLMSHRLSPQAVKVLRHMLKFGSITNVEAHSILKVRSVSRRITELSEREHIEIRKERKVDDFGQRYVRYSLLDEVEVQYARDLLGDESPSPSVH